MKYPLSLLFAAVLLSSSVSATRAFANQCGTMLQGAFFEPTEGFHRNLLRVKSDQELIVVLRKFGWTVDTSRYWTGPGSPSELGVVSFTYGPKREQRITLNVSAFPTGHLNRSEILRLGLALGNRQSFITTNAIPSYVASQKYTADIDAILKQYVQFLEPGSSRVEIRRQPGEFEQDIVYAGARFRVYLRLPDPMGENIVATPEQLKQLETILSTRDGFIRIDGNP